VRREVAGDLRDLVVQLQDLRDLRGQCLEPVDDPLAVLERLDFAAKPKTS